MRGLAPTKRDLMTKFFTFSHAGMMDDAETVLANRSLPVTINNVRALLQAWTALHRAQPGVHGHDGYIVDFAALLDDGLLDLPDDMNDDRSHLPHVEAEPSGDAETPTGESAGAKLRGCNACCFSRSSHLACNHASRPVSARGRHGGQRGPAAGIGSASPRETLACGSRKRGIALRQGRR